MAFCRKYTPSDKDKSDWDKKLPTEKEAIVTEEYTAYLRERDNIQKDIGDIQNNLSTLLITISTVAIGTSLTLLKDVVHDLRLPLVVSWIAFVLCIFGCLLDRLLSFIANRNFLKVYDEVFSVDDYHGHAFREIEAQHKAMKLPAWFSFLRFANAVFVIVGVTFLITYVTGIHYLSAADKTQQPITIELNLSTTQPTATDPSGAIKAKLSGTRPTSNP